MTTKPSCRPIPIPGNDHVGYGEMISLNFLEAGTFTPSADPTAFTPPLKPGHYPMGDSGECYRADTHDHDIPYDFKPDGKGAKRVMQTIHISNTHLDTKDDKTMQQTIHISNTGLGKVDPTD